MGEALPGILEGVRIIEIGALGPAPFCGMMLADHGAEVILIQRPDARQAPGSARNVLNRSRRHLYLDLKSPRGVELVKRLAKTADGIIEGYRPGVMERLGLGPDSLMAGNPGLVYGRMTGWGQAGPMARRAGHDINYIAISGVLDLMGRAGDRPLPPLNLLGDFGGGGMLLAFAMVSGILSARTTGRGSVVDCAMVDGAALLSAMVWTHRAQGRWPGGRGENLLDTGAPFYEVYETSDGRHVAFGAIEPQFYAEFLRGLGLAGDPEFADQHDRARWPARKKRVAGIVGTRSRREWEAVFEELDACFSPVLTLDEAAAHPQNLARRVFTDVQGVRQPSPAPRFMGLDMAAPVMPGRNEASAAGLLSELGCCPDEIASLREEGAFGQEDMNNELSDNPA